MKRRVFLKGLSSALLLGAPAGFAGDGGKRAPRFLFGACAGLGRARALKAAGFDYIEPDVPSVFLPGKDDEAFKLHLETLRALPLPIRSCTCFLPRRLRLTGPAVKHAEALDYAERVCRRADLAGVPYVVLGSGGARRAPEGFDIRRAVDQFVDFCRALGGRIDGCRVTVLLEPLRKRESNFLQTVAEGADLVDRIGRPRIRLVADMFHMRCEGETAASILKAGGRILHCHIAEKQGRMAPGTAGESFADYFRALREIGFSGGISCECGWPPEKTRPIGESYALALETLRKQ